MVELHRNLVEAVFQLGCSYINRHGHHRPDHWRFVCVVLNDKEEVIKAINLTWPEWAKMDRRQFGQLFVGFISMHAIEAQEWVDGEIVNNWRFHTSLSHRSGYATTQLVGKDIATKTYSVENSKVDQYKPEVAIGLALDRAMVHGRPFSLRFRDGVRQSEFKYVGVVSTQDVLYDLCTRDWHKFDGLSLNVPDLISPYHAEWLVTPVNFTKPQKVTAKVAPHRPRPHKVHSHLALAFNAAKSRAENWVKSNLRFNGIKVMFVVHWGNEVIEHAQEFLHKPGMPNPGQMHTFAGFTAMRGKVDVMTIQEGQDFWRCLDTFEYDCHLQNYAPSYNDTAHVEDPVGCAMNTVEHYNARPFHPDKCTGYTVYAKATEQSRAYRYDRADPSSVLRNLKTWRELFSVSVVAHITLANGMKRKQRVCHFMKKPSKERQQRDMRFFMFSVPDISKHGIDFTLRPFQRRAGEIMESMGRKAGKTAQQQTFFDWLAEDRPNFTPPNKTPRTPFGMSPIQTPAERAAWLQAERYPNPTKARFVEATTQGFDVLGLTGDLNCKYVMQWPPIKPGVYDARDKAFYNHLHDGVKAVSRYMTAAELEVWIMLCMHDKDSRAYAREVGRVIGWFDLNNAAVLSAKDWKVIHSKAYKGNR